ncbi:FAD-dependent monooxygenase [Nocardioides soli]|uniref:Flavin-dependent dehydrogenase n=1 Tax=Nocardioides soli TaxID=1036020 RepID=A0A7W4YZK2_9ACTN|nr:flavin-dependent dehydrogenase [Nocardioides soli]
MSQRDLPYDVVVVGARCAGATTARLLATRGLRVALVDRAPLSRDPLSTHGIARGGVVQLSRWGLLDRVLESGAPPVREVTFGAPAGERTVPLKARAGVDLVVAPRRRVLDALLADAAVHAGAELRADLAVDGLVRDGAGRVTGVTARTSMGGHVVLRARHVVGADGLRSTVARLVDAETTCSFAADLSLFYLYVRGAPWRGFEFHVADRAFSGVFPTHDDTGCVWIVRPTALLDGVRAAGARRDAALLSELDDVAVPLAARARVGHPVSKVRGVRALPNHVRRAHGAGWSLVGDAGYHRDPITGHGITDAFRDAELLADALTDGLGGARPEASALAAYESARDVALADVFRLTRELTAFPDPAHFVELQLELAEALDREATQLASRPEPAGLDAASAA